MAFNFLGLVNNALGAVNEVQLDSSTFSGATGFETHVKDAVNFAIRHINQQAFEWPFNHVNQETTLVVGQVRYDLPADCKSLHMKSFRIKGDASLNITTSPLFVTDYEEWVKNRSDEENRPSLYLNLPEGVFRAPDGNFGIFPPADQAYTLQYEYSRLPVDLVDWDDVPSCPVSFEHVIFEGTMYYIYKFRGETERAMVSWQNFEKAIKNQRTIYINRFEYVKNTQKMM